MPLLIVKAVLEKTAVHVISLNLDRYWGFSRNLLAFYLEENNHLATGKELQNELH